MSELYKSFEGTVDFTRIWFEEKLKKVFDFYFFSYIKFKEYPFPIQREYRHETAREKELKPPINNIDIVFLAGGTCRIPFIKGWITDQFPNAEVIDGELEVITAKGAAIHALQVLSGEIEPYIKLCEHENSKSNTDIQ